MKKVFILTSLSVFMMATAQFRATTATKDASHKMSEMSFSRSSSVDSFDSDLCPDAGCASDRF